MAILEPEAVHPNFTAPYVNVPALLSAAEVRNAWNSQLAAETGNSNLSMGALERICQIMGNGHLSGGTIAAGVGMSVDIGAWEAIVGTPIGNDASTTVGGLEPSSVNYIFARQNGGFTINQDGSDPPTATYGDFLLWGTATTDGSGVTAVTNTRASFANGLFTATTQTYTATNVSTDRSYNANATTLDELADIVGTLLSDLRAKGIVL